MAYATTEVSAAPKQPNIQSAIESFDPAIKRLEVLIGRASACADRVIGSRPSAVEGIEKDPSPSHLVWAIDSRRERLSRAVDQLEIELQRIEGGLS